ncbi:uncharacterized protein AB675_4715 [Cyphellophora attinorum]|uniref:Uncharacterized protein n=1 Tax=Cyphellophora attinorum TaxID=1664694 RepID=A0A0N0NLG9_9EURO|nr:uncharacterized protein AB675_4715 [Phialophora attinorum]KPI39029.1 hypothetical protein AB675_4715 [Phialophora attinorum]
MATKSTATVSPNDVLSPDNSDNEATHLKHLTTYEKIKLARPGPCLTVMSILIATICTGLTMRQGIDTYQMGLIYIGGILATFVGTTLAQIYARVVTDSQYARIITDSRRKPSRTLEFLGVTTAIWQSSGGFAGTLHAEIASTMPQPVNLGLACRPERLNWTPGEYLQTQHIRHH